jgi:hypothetical protein
MTRQIVAFHQDEVGDGVAALACGHGRHMRHKPPCASRKFISMTWVLLI